MGQAENVEARKTDRDEAEAMLCQFFDVGARWRNKDRIESAPAEGKGEIEAKIIMIP